MSTEFLTSQVERYPLLSLLGSFIAGLILWGIVYAVQKGRERRKAEEEKREGGRRSPLSDLPAARWLNRDDSPTGRRVLDCRPIALGVHLTTEDSDVLEKFFNLADTDGSELEGRSPENSWLVGVDWGFDFEQAELIEEGMFPEVTEDLWRIDCRGGRLYFRRSWTGQLVFMTNFNRIPSSGGQITRIWVPGVEPFTEQSSEYMAAYVRHLLDTHLLNVATPFPIPPGFPRDDKKIAALVFYSMGRRGWLAEYFKDSQN